MTHAHADIRVPENKQGTREKRSYQWKHGHGGVRVSSKVTQCVDIRQTCL